MVHGHSHTGVSSHIAASQGNLSSDSNLSHLNKKLFFGNEQGIPIQGSGHTTLPISHIHKQLNLTHVLHTPRIVKKLVFVQQLITGSNVFVSCDSFGFLVNDFPTVTPLMRCNILGDLYPVTTSYLFDDLTNSLWRGRLGHSNYSALQFLHSNKVISYKPLNYMTIWASCVFEKHVRLCLFPPVMLLWFPLIFYIVIYTHHQFWVQVVIAIKFYF